MSASQEIADAFNEVVKAAIETRNECGRSSEIAKSQAEFVRQLRDILTQNKIDYDRKNC